MGQKGDKSSTDGAKENDWILEQISDIEGVSSKKMFGGYGIFHEGKMFGMITAKGQFAIKANDETKDKFIEAGGEKHSRMPYYSVPENIIEDHSTLLLWINEAIALSKK